MKTQDHIRIHILLSLVVVMLIFAIGASYNKAQIIETYESDLAVEFEAEASRLQMIIEVQDEKLTTLKAQNIELSEMVVLSKEKEAMYGVMQGVLEILNYPEDVVERAYRIFKDTPLDFESSLYLIKYCDLYEIDPSLVLSLIEVESNFDKEAVGGHQDRGLMQIIPSTEKWLAESFGSDIGLVYDPALIFEPQYNLGLAISYIHLLKEAYGENYHRILSEYNRGPYNLKKYYDKHQTWQTSYSRSILSRVDKYAYVD